MGAFDDITNITIPDPADPEKAASFRRKWRWDSHEQVVLKGEYTTYDQEVVGNGSSFTDPKKGVVFQMGTGRVMLMKCMIVGWTLTRNGNVLPLSLETIRRLPSRYSSPILEKCDELAQAMTEEEQEDFFQPANGHIEVDSDEMSILPIRL